MRDQLWEIASHDLLACRGQPEHYDNGELYSSIDRVFRQTKVVGSTAVAIERLSIERFVQQAPTYLSPIETHHLQQGPSLLTLMRHYGAPTRLLDWSESVWIAAFNAASGGWGKDGCIWAFQRDEFDTCVGTIHKAETWCACESVRASGFAAPMPGVIAYELKPWVCRLMNIGPRIPRVVAQQGMFTISSKLGLDHAKCIDDTLPDENGSLKRKLFVPKEHKLRLLKELHKMGITPTSLYPGVDGVGKYLSVFTHWAQTDAGVLATVKGWGELQTLEQPVPDQSRIVVPRLPMPQ